MLLPLQRHHRLLPMFTHTPPQLKVPLIQHSLDLSGFTTKYTRRYVNTAHSLPQVMKREYS